MNTYLSKLSIRIKMLMGYLLTFLVSVILGNLIIFIVTHKTIENNTEQELSNSTNIIMNMVKSAADASIKNHLRAVAEKNRDIVQYYYNEYKLGKMSEEAAQKKASEVLLTQIIGKTGYIYCVNSQGVLQVHPKINGSDLSKYDFIHQQTLNREGYIEYEWANPGEESPRLKALYMTYFGPWDWIISVSSYREEFKDLFRVGDFRDDILAVSFGKTGYPYVMDSKGNLIIHPKLQGHNIYDSKDSNGREFVKEMCAQKSGKIIYPWQNPGENYLREKLVIFNYIPEFDWIVASSSYLEEFNGPLVTIGYASLITLTLVILLIVPITLIMSNSINKPIQEIIQGFSLGAQGDYSSHIHTTNQDEIGKLANYYNEFMSKLSESSRSLQASEERFRLLFENAVEGVFTINADGKFLNVNPSMAKMLGYDGREHLIREISNFGAKAYIDLSEQNRLVNELKRTGTINGFETTYKRRDGSSIWISLNARAYTDDNGALTTIDGFCNDITEKKKTEEIQIRIKEELEQRVEERTAQLSSYIDILELRNTHESLLREMGEMLQVCRSVDESFPIINQYVSLFFPKQNGALFLFATDKNILKSVVSWGNTDEIEMQFNRDECWALRQGKMYGICNNINQLLPCEHIQKKENLAYLCLPITAQGEVLGLLHIVQPCINEDIVCIDQNLKAIATTFTDHLGLSLANLKLQEKLRNQSMTDPLTGLYNRRFMEEFAQKELLRAKRHASTFSMIILDIDYFKNFNDTYGHNAGDLVLQEIAFYFQKHCRISDIVCRYGGEEFVILLPNCLANDAMDLAEKLCRGVREHVRIPYHNATLSVTISMGVASIPTHGKELDEMIKAADRALYQAKGNGRDRVIMAM
jgi:diguanylate cyclase (GGDEF)-like protein/PAS domain S-box-containing protein